MKHLTESQIAMSNFPYFRYPLDWTLDSLARLGAGPIELYLNDPHFHVEDSGTTQCRALKRKLAERGMRVINLCPEQVKYPINIASANPYARQRSVDTTGGGRKPESRIWKLIHSVCSVPSRASTSGQRWWTTSFHTVVIRNFSGIRTTGSRSAKAATIRRP